MSAIVFEVIDVECQAADQSFFPPRMLMTTNSTTTIATLRGYSEFIASTPPKKYKKLTWTGFSEQAMQCLDAFDGFPLPALDLTKYTDPIWNSMPITTRNYPVAHAKYVWDGAGEIDAKGNQISNYQKNYFSACTNGFEPFINSIQAAPPSTFKPAVIKGYCWSGIDPRSCTDCNEPPVFIANVSRNGGFDDPEGFAIQSTNVTTTPTSRVNDSTGSGIISHVITSLQDGSFGSTTGIPPSLLNGIEAPWLNVFTINNYSATLSDEYTDAEALANALIISGHGATAQTLARTTGFVSTWTNVVFTLAFSNLIVGSSYNATVDLVDTSGPTTSKTTKAYGFTASKVTHSIVDIVPTPAQAHTITVRNPTVAFVT